MSVPIRGGEDDGNARTTKARHPFLARLDGGGIFFGDEAERNGGGTYIIAYGPMIVGGVRFLQGLFGMMG